MLSHDVAAQLYEYIRRHWHLATDDDADSPLDELRRSAMLQGPVSQSAGPWYTFYCRGGRISDTPTMPALTIARLITVPPTLHTPMCAPVPVKAGLITFDCLAECKVKKGLL